MNGPAIEQRALRFSTVGYLLMGGLGIGFFLVTRSEAILLDGVYSLVSFGASLMAARVARLVHRPGSETFHFGYAHLEPLLNTLRGFLIVGLSAFALASAVDALLHGGRPIAAGLAMVYGVSAAALCLLMAWNQRRLARKVGSPLLDVDARTWFVDGIISAGAAAGFFTAYLFERLDLHHLLPYVDPTLVVLLVLVMARVPLKTLWENLREVLQVAPPVNDQQAVRTAIEGAVADLPTREVQVRMVKVGRFFYVLTHVLLPEDWRPESTGALDAVRCRIARSLTEVPLRLVTDTVFTADAHWTSFEDDRGCEDPTKA